MLVGLRWRGFHCSVAVHCSFFFRNGAKHSCLLLVCVLTEGSIQGSCRTYVFFECLSEFLIHQLASAGQSGEVVSQYKFTGHFGKGNYEFQQRLISDRRAFVSHGFHVILTLAESQFAFVTWLFMMPLLGFAML